MRRPIGAKFFPDPLNPASTAERRAQGHNPTPYRVILDPELIAPAPGQR